MSMWHFKPFLYWCRHKTPLVQVQKRMLCPLPFFHTHWMLFNQFSKTSYLSVMMWLRRLSRWQHHLPGGKKNNKWKYTLILFHSVLIWQVNDNIIIWYYHVNCGALISFGKLIPLNLICRWHWSVSVVKDKTSFSKQCRL